MYLSRITIGKCSSNPRERPQPDVAEEYLAALLHNGQVLGDYLLAPCEGTLVAYTHVARPNALAKRWHSQWGLASLRQVVKAFGQLPQCEIIEDNVPTRFTSWKKSSSFYIFTHAFDDASPLCCGDSGVPVPLYLLPISDLTREHLYFWAIRYRDHDRVWFDSGVLEVPAYKQMADPRSELSVIGRELCQEVETATGKRTFYYLHRYWGRSVGEQTRLCPLCGRRWHTSLNRPQNSPFWRFAFRCVRCRLVSHCADSYDDEQHAAIGEYRRPSKSRPQK
jgi:predicted  nucleic acid-binding Zn ribbon protein